MAFIYFIFYSNRFVNVYGNWYLGVCCVGLQLQVVALHRQPLGLRAHHRGPGTVGCPVAASPRGHVQRKACALQTLRAWSGLPWKQSVYPQWWKNNNLFLVFLTLFIPCGKFGLPFLGKIMVATRAALPIPPSVWYFRMSKQCYGCQCLGFSTCAQMLRHVIAHGGCTDTVRQSALKAESARKSLAAPGNWTFISIAPGFSVWCSTNWAIPSLTGDGQRKEL